MPTAEFYAYAPGFVASVCTELRSVGTSQDREAWAGWYERFSNVMIPDFPAHPIIEIKRHAGWPDLDPSDPPSPDSPSLAWITRQYLLDAAPLHFGGIDGFHGSFTDGLNMSSRMPAAADAALHRRYVEAMFYPPECLSDDVWALREGDSNCAYVDAETLRALVRDDDAVGFSARLEESVRAETWGRSCADGIANWAAFLRTAATRSLDVYYAELAT